MSRIHKLDPHLVNQIAAGEVVERPGSVVKELVENAIDAEASELVITIDEGGKKLIRVQDNGCGMTPQELALCVQSHATSKIVCSEDLDCITTLGFRGEALPSIGSVSRMTITSRRPDSNEAATICVEGGQVTPVAPAGGAVGTTIEVRNLFYNIPARRKFLKTDATELGHILDVVAAVALAYPQVAMRVEHNGRLVHDLPAAQTVRSRVAAFFGQALADQLIELQCESPAGRLWGLVAPPAESRATNKMQYLFLNGRYIRDRSLLHAVRESYRGLLEHNRQPVVFLYLEVPPESVDVNVHPTKIEVRLRNGQQLYRELLVTLRNKFLTSDLTPRIMGSASSDNSPFPAGGNFMSADNARDRVRQSLADFLRAPAPVQHNFDYRRQPTSPAHAVLPPSAEAGNGDDETTAGFTAPAGPAGPAGSPASEAHNAAAPAGPAAPADDSAIRSIIQLHNTYLVAETDEGMLIVDQHALHERVLYQELRERITGGPLESQRMLIPAVMDVTPRELAFLEEQRPMFEKLGIDFEQFGAASIGIQCFPSLICRRLQPERVMRDLLEWAAAQQNDNLADQALDELLHRMACHAAVKSGDRLSQQEMQALLQQRDLAEMTATCPHGRPTSLILPKDELERQFKRDYRSIKPIAADDDSIPF